MSVSALLAVFQSAWVRRVASRRPTTDQSTTRVRDGVRNAPSHPSVYHPPGAIRLPTPEEEDAMLRAAELAIMREQPAPPQQLHRVA